METRVQSNNVDVRRHGVVLVEDHAILRQGLRALLELESDLNVVGEAGDAVEAEALIKELAPCLAIVDVALPGRSGIELIGALRAIQPQLKVLILTAHNTEEYVRATLNAGADGYVLKDASRTDLLHAIRSVIAGQKYLCASVTAQVVCGYLQRPAAPVESISLQLANITEREREVLTRVALGQSNKHIARALDVSVKTVEKHRANLMRKLALRNAAAVTRYAILHNLIGAADIDANRRAPMQETALLAGAQRTSIGMDGVERNALIQ